jgi:hypothetical protein
VPAVTVGAGRGPDAPPPVPDNGYVTLPDLPGIAFEGKGDPYREMRKLSA